MSDTKSRLLTRCVVGITGRKLTRATEGVKKPNIYDGIRAANEVDVQNHRERVSTARKAPEGVALARGGLPALFGGAHLPARLNDERKTKFRNFSSGNFKPRERATCGEGVRSGRANLALRRRAESAAPLRGRLWCESSDDR